jgi:hypothetical protein
MTRRLVVIGAVALVIAVAGFWISRNTYWADVEVPMPLRGEARTNPFYATQRFAQALGSRTSWDHTFVAPSAGGVLVMSGWHWSMSSQRREAVEEWVEQGGRLVLDATVADDPAFQAWSGTSIVAKKEQSAGLPGRRIAACHPLVLSAVSEMSATTPSRSLTTCGVAADSHLESTAAVRWQLSDDAGPQVISSAAGNGSVTVINATPFLARGLFDGDHAALFVAATGMRTGEEVRFLSETDVPPLLALLWQRGSPAVVLLLALVGLWLWRIGSRFGPPVPSATPPRRSLEEQIVAAGEFCRRYATSDPLVAATQQALEEAASRRIPGYARLSPDERVAVLAKATGLASQSLHRAMHNTDYRILDPVHIMETARRQLLRQTRT